MTLTLLAVGALAAASSAGSSSQLKPFSGDPSHPGSSRRGCPYSAYPTSSSNRRTASPARSSPNPLHAFGSLFVGAFAPSEVFVFQARGSSFGFYWKKKSLTRRKREGLGRFRCQINVVPMVLCMLLFNFHFIFIHSHFKIILNKSFHSIYAGIPH